MRPTWYIFITNLKYKRKDWKLVYHDFDLFLVAHRISKFKNTEKENLHAIYIMNFYSTSNISSMVFIFSYGV